MHRISTGVHGGRPMVMGSRGVISSGHYLASEAGLWALRQGGNAMDAAAAAGFVLPITSPHQNGIGGEAPMLVYSAGEDATWALSGQGTAPRAATIGKVRELGLDLIPGDGLLAAAVPAAVAAWILLLRRFGTMRLADILAPAIELAESGVPIYDTLHDYIQDNAEKLRRDWPSSAEVYLVKGAAPAVGTLWRQPDAAATLRRMAKVDRRYRKRDDGLRAAHDEFYCGSIARKIAEFCRSAVPDSAGRHAGLLTIEDLASHEARLEAPVSTTYRNWRVCKCGPWTQGPVLLQTLNLLEGFDLAGMGQNSADYIHTVVECMKLAYADREFYYGDPDFVDVPLERLLSKAYAAKRRQLVEERASMRLRPGGHGAIDARSIRDVNRAFEDGAGYRQGDTISVQVVDRAGNVVSAVPSGGWLQSSPVVPGLGFPLGSRMQMFSLAEGHPDALAPGKRPRTTLTPSLAGHVRRSPELAFASPGGDSQDQWTLQFFLSVVEFGMSLQQAVEAPSFWTDHFPSSFYPRAANPGSLHVEMRIGRDVCDELARRGHKIIPGHGWSGGNSMAAAIDRTTGVLSAAASPRYDPAYAIGF